MYLPKTKQSPGTCLLLKPENDKPYKINDTNQPGELWEAKHSKLLNMSCLWGFQTRLDTNLAVQPQRMARGLKPQIYVVEGLYHQCSERKADLCLCFRIYAKGRFAHDEAHMSLVVRKPAFCICENKDADQLRSNREADQRLSFRYIDSTIPLLPKSEI